MRRSILFTATYLLLALSMVAQEGFHIGAGGIFQSTWITNKEEEYVNQADFDYKATWGYGAYFKLGYNIGPPLGFHTNVIWSTQGQKSSYKDSLGTHEFNRKLTYVKIPLFLHVSSNPGPVMFHFGAGPYYGIIMGAEHTNDDQIVDYSALNIDADALYLQDDIGIAFYIGWAINLSDEKVWWDVDIYGDRSIRDIENKQLNVLGTNVYKDARPASLNFNVGIKTGINFAIPVGGGGGGQHWIR